MASPLPPDPYVALGVPKDSTAAVVKTTYRKLALKYHPDKVKEESQKAEAADQFHKIQTAYEILGDEDRRARYDAQVRLIELRKDVLLRQGGAGSRVEVRTAQYDAPSATGRSSMPARGAERVYEERRPAAADSDYFDTASPKVDARRGEYTRPSRASASRVEQERDRLAREKEEEKARRNEKNRRSAKDERRDRERKYARVDEDSESDSEAEAYEAARRRRQYEDDRRRAKEQEYEIARRQTKEVPAAYYDDTRAKKDAAREYIERSRGGGRPTAERVDSSRGPIEVLRSAGRPAVMRRASERQKPSESPRRASARDHERRSSAADIPEEPREPSREKERRPPTLAQSKSSPAQIVIPGDRPSRRHTEDMSRMPIREPIRRSETMPNTSSRSRVDHSVPVRKSGLRETVISEGLPTPDATPTDYFPPSAKYRYGKEYADDHEYPTPNGYRTEVREPKESRKPFERSPSPMSRVETRPERPRAASSRYANVVPPPPLRTTSYVYTPSGVQETSPQAYSPRPSLAREASTRGRTLYGEIQTSNSRYEAVSPMVSGKYSPPLEGVRYQKEIRPTDVKMATGYNVPSSRRPSEGMRPTMSRSGSYNSTYVR